MQDTQERTIVAAQGAVAPARRSAGGREVFYGTERPPGSVAAMSSSPPVATAGTPPLQPLAATGSETARQLVAQLAELFWKQGRLARAEQALKARQLEELESSRAGLAAAVGQASSAEPQKSVITMGLTTQKDSPSKFEDLLEYLKALREAADERPVSATWLGAYQVIWGDAPTMRGATIREMFEELERGNTVAASGACPDAGRVSSPCDRETSSPQPSVVAASCVSPPCGDRHVVATAASVAPHPANGAGSEPGYSHGDAREETVRDLLIETIEDEIEQVRGAYRRYRRTEIEISPALRESQLAPLRREWALLIRQRSAVFRQIERTLKLLMTLRPPGALVPADDTRGSLPPRGRQELEDRSPSVVAASCVSPPGGDKHVAATKETKKCKTKPISPVESTKLRESGSSAGSLSSPAGRDGSGDSGALKTRGGRAMST